MLTTGVKKFDEITGGIPEGSITMLLGPANIGKSDFCTQFLWEGLKKGHPMLLILTRGDPKDVINNFEKVGCKIEDYAKKEMVKIIDCYSEFIGIKSARSYVTKVSGPSDLTALSFQVFNTLKDYQKFQKPVRCVLHSISTLFLYNTPETMLRFFTHMIGMAKTMNATLIFTLERIIGEEMAHKISELVDGMIEFKVERELFLINPQRLGKRLFGQWIQYKLTETGIKLI
jgi:KaiC/GvpD/RAD55 family RecA-like ATPase